MKGTGIKHREDKSENIITIKKSGKLVNKHSQKAKNTWQIMTVFRLESCVYFVSKDGFRNNE